MSGGAAGIPLLAGSQALRELGQERNRLSVANE